MSTDAAAWPERYTRTIANQIRHHRKARGLSCQQLSDRCTELGMPIARPVLSHLELGRRENITVAELFTIARALGVPPIALMLPDEGPVEIGDGRYAARHDAHAWITGLTSPSALDTLAAELDAARVAVDRARLALGEALGGPVAPRTSDLEGQCAFAVASSVAQLQCEADAQRAENGGAQLVDSPVPRVEPVQP